MNGFFVVFDVARWTLGYFCVSCIVFVFVIGLYLMVIVTRCMCWRFGVWIVIYFYAYYVFVGADLMISSVVLCFFCVLVGLVGSFLNEVVLDYWMFLLSEFFVQIFFIFWVGLFPVKMFCFRRDMWHRKIGYFFWIGFFFWRSFWDGYSYQYLIIRGVICLCSFGFGSLICWFWFVLFGLVIREFCVFYLLGFLYF